MRFPAIFIILSFISSFSSVLAVSSADRLTRFMANHGIHSNVQAAKRVTILAALRRQLKKKNYKHNTHFQNLLIWLTYLNKISHQNTDPINLQHYQIDYGQIEYILF